MSNWELGIFTSIDAGLGTQLDVVRQLGVSTIHLHAPHPERRTADDAERFAAQLRDLDIEVTCMFAGFEGESYESIPICVQTVGLVPLKTREQRTREFLQIAEFAKLMKVGSVGLHIGFVPHETAGDDYRSIVETTQQVCTRLADQGQSLHLETGQETTDVLLQFMTDVNADNLFVNFDPANMILYGSGDPIEALRELGEHVRSVHVKDAIASDQPGVTWGREMPVGDGAVGMERYLRTLQSIGYGGPLTIEREIPGDPEQQRQDIANALTLLTSLREELTS